MQALQTPAPTPSTWTLKFKRDKITVVLFVQPDQSFASIKQAFLEALEARKITRFEDQAVPKSSNEIMFAKLRTVNDTESGWESLTPPSQGGDPSETRGSNKRKLSGGGRLDCPVGLGLKDGAILAFKFGNPSEMDEDDEEDSCSGYQVTFPPLDVEEPDEPPPVT